MLRIFKKLYNNNNIFTILKCYNSFYWNRIEHTWVECDTKIDAYKNSFLQLYYL